MNYFYHQLITKKKFNFMNLFTNLHNPITRHKLYNYIFTTYNIIYTSIETYSFETKLRYSDQTKSVLINH